MRKIKLSELKVIFDRIAKEGYKTPDTLTTAFIALISIEKNGLSDKKDISFETSQGMENLDRFHNDMNDNENYTMFLSLANLYFSHPKAFDLFE